MESSHFLDFDEAVTYLKTTPSTLYKWLQAGKIPAHKLGRQWRFSPAELENYISGATAKSLVSHDLKNLEMLLKKRSKNIKEDKMEMNQNRLVENLIWDAYEHGTRTIYIYPKSGKFEIAYRFKNNTEKLIELQEETMLSLKTAIEKASVALESEDSRRMLVRESAESSANVLQVRYQKIETISGPRLTIWIWQPEKDVMELEKINSGNADVLKEFKSWTKKTNGLFIVTGAPGSGKTTTTYSLLNEFKNAGCNVFTVEDSVQMIVDGINQIETNIESSDKFDAVFKKIYASDPDVICLGLTNYTGYEENVFTACYRAAASGHVVILQMDKATVTEARETLSKFSSLPFNDVIKGISAQRLIEKDGKVKAEYNFS